MVLVPYTRKVGSYSTVTSPVIWRCSSEYQIVHMKGKVPRLSDVSFTTTTWPALISFAATLKGCMAKPWVTVSVLEYRKYIGYFDKGLRDRACMRRGRG